MGRWLFLPVGCSFEKANLFAFGNITGSLQPLIQAGVIEDALVLLLQRTSILLRFLHDLRLQALRSPPKIIQIVPSTCGHPNDQYAGNSLSTEIFHDRFIFRIVEIDITGLPSIRPKTTLWTGKKQSIQSLPAAGLIPRPNLQGHRQYDFFVRKTALFHYFS